MVVNKRDGIGARNYRFPSRQRAADGYGSPIDADRAVGSLGGPSIDRSGSIPRWKSLMALKGRLEKVKGRRVKQFARCVTATVNLTEIDR